MVSFQGHGMSQQEAYSKFDEVFSKAGIVDGQTYLDPMRGIDMRKEMGAALVKSGVIKLEKGPSVDSNTGGSYTAQGLIPLFPDPLTVDKTIRETPLVKLFARKAIRGLSYVHNNLDTKAGAKFLPEDSSLSDQVDTRTTTTTAMTFLYAVGRVTGPSQAGAQGFKNLLEMDIRVKTDSMNEALENQIINGTTAPGDANGFAGLYDGITTNSTSSAGAEVTLQNIRDDFDAAFRTGGSTGTGLIDLVFTDGRTHNFIKGLLQDFQRNVEQPSGMMDFGIPDAFMFDGALFIRDRFATTTAASRRIVYLDTRYVFLAVLQDMTFFELAKTNDSDKFAVKFYGAMILTFEQACAQRTSLA